MYHEADGERAHESEKKPEHMGRTTDSTDSSPTRLSEKRSQELTELCSKTIAKPCGSQFVITDDNAFRKTWNLVVVAMLLYIGSIFPYKLCFFEFGMPEPIEASLFWQVLDTGVDILFWFDLVVCFFCSYEDEHKDEVLVLKQIVYNYMQGYFWLNLVACLPPSFFTWFAGIFMEQSSSDSPSINQASRMLRIQRLTRLVRLGRLTRLARMIQFLTRSPLIRSLRSSRGLRIMTLVVALLWVVHLVGCGWFLCASIHEVPLETWVGRRTVNVDGDSLLFQAPHIQWCHAAYFVLTVFTTVGFGDMSATTSGEIVYVCFTMILGAIINSIIVGEVINIVTSADREQITMREHKAQIEAFCTHTDLDVETRLHLCTWVEKESATFDYDDNGMQKILTSGRLPRVILDQLPDQMFGGQLVRNSFVTLCSLQVRQVPPRFSVLLALKVYQISFMPGEFVYHYNDHPFNLFLVRAGIFAHVAKVGAHCGYHEVPDQIIKVADRNSSLMSKLHGVLMPVDCDPNDKEKAYNASLSATLCPFRLIGMTSFFGDGEVIEGKPRQTTVRCEAANGLLLCIPKQDLYSLMLEYPHFARAWRAAALRHDRQNRQLLSQICEADFPSNHKHLAANILVKNLRIFKDKRKAICAQKNGASSSGSPSRARLSANTGYGDISKVSEAATKYLYNFSTTPRSSILSTAQEHTQNLAQTASDAKMATLQNSVLDMKGNMGVLTGQMSHLQGSVDGMQCLLQEVLINLKSKDVSKALGNGTLAL